MSALLTHPVSWFLATLATYAVARYIHARLNHAVWCQPLLLAVAVLATLLLLSDTPYSRYRLGTEAIHLLLAPATVALAIPLYANLAHVRSLLRPLLVALCVGGLTGIVSALAIGKALGLSYASLVSFAPKSVTTPIAMALSEKLGGNPSLTAAVVILTGVVGALGASALLRVLRIDDEPTQGFAIGVASHGIGTTRALQISARAGAFSGLGMSLNGIFTSLALPLVLSLWPA